MDRIDFNKIRKDLIEIYKNFLENPDNEEIIKKAFNYEKEYGGLSTYNEYLKSQPVPEEIEKALNWLSALYQFGIHEKNHYLSEDKILKEAKKILEELKEN